VSPVNFGNRWVEFVERARRRNGRFARDPVVNPTAQGLDFARTGAGNEVSQQLAGRGTRFAFDPPDHQALIGGTRDCRRATFAPGEQTFDGPEIQIAAS